MNLSNLYQKIKQKKIFHILLGIIIGVFIFSPFGLLMAPIAILFILLFRKWYVLTGVGVSAVLIAILGILFMLGMGIEGCMQNNTFSYCLEALFNEI